MQINLLPFPSPSPTPTQQEAISLAEVTQHTSSSDCWTVIEGQVYNVSGYVSLHPGGGRILQACGKDASDLFSGKSAMGHIHSQIPRQLLAKYRVGSLAN